MDLCHEEKRRELETRLGKFCRITRPLINNQQLFIEVNYRKNQSEIIRLCFQNPIINIEDLRKLIAETDNEERVSR